MGSPPLRGTNRSPMSAEPPSTTGPAHRSLWDRLGHMLSGEPRSPEELLVELREAQSNGLLTSETYAMIEGAIRVTEMVVGDVMVPRAQMVTLGIDDDPAVSAIWPARCGERHGSPNERATGTS